jgi:zinc protease
MGTKLMQVPAHEPVIETLPNGLQTIIKPDPQAPVVSVQIWVRTGSVHEEKWLGGGISHLLEHMLFNGTERRKSKEISAEIQAIGGYVNAYTSFDRTVYWIESPPDGFATAVDVLGDMALHSILPEDEFNKELDVIRREMAMGDDSPGQLCSKLLFRTAFQTHPCQHPVIGHARRPLGLLSPALHAEQHVRRRFRLRETEESPAAAGESFRLNPAPAATAGARSS